MAPQGASKRRWHGTDSAKVGEQLAGTRACLCREPQGAPGGWAQGGRLECQEATAVGWAFG